MQITDHEIAIQEVLAQMRSMAVSARAGVEPSHTDDVPNAGFGEVLKQSISDVNSLQGKARELTAAFERGEPGIDLAEVMIAGQKASIAFDAMTQVRNRLVSAYQEIMRMPI